MKTIHTRRAAAPADPTGFGSTGCLKIPSEFDLRQPAQILDPNRLDPPISGVGNTSLCQTPLIGKRAILYGRVSTSDGRQSVANQIDELRGVAGRAGWHVVGIYTDEASGSKGPKQRPGFQKVIDAITKRDAQVVAAWSIDRVSRSISDFVNFVQHAQSCGVSLYLHQQNVDSSTPTGFALLSLCSVLAELERALLAERVRAGLNRARAEGKRLGRPTIPEEIEEKVRVELCRGSGIRATSRAIGVSTATVTRIRDELQAA
jgi:DNA invertase Pin-like site-specific DNA recombinase